MTRVGPPAVAGSADGTRELANRLVAGLASRPFQPTGAELVGLMGSALDGRPGDESSARSAAAGYAFLFADHVVQDVTAPQAAGAYVRLWLCARQAFLDRRADDSQRPVVTDLEAWQNEGGANVG